MRLALVLMMTLGGQAVAPPAVAAGTVSAAAALYTTHPGLAGLQLTSDNEEVSVTRSDDMFTFQHRAGSQIWSLTIRPPVGRKLGVGQFRASDTVSDPAAAWVLLAIGSQSQQFAGSLDILDWALGVNGLPYRWDIAFRTPEPSTENGVWGQTRKGQDDGQRVSIAATRLAWPLTPVASTPVHATERLRNVSTKPVSVGTLGVSGDAATDYRISNNGCSGRTLAPGAACTVSISFVPTRGGPHLATLAIPIGGVRRTVSLAGDAVLGTTTLTMAGGTYVTEGRRLSWTEGGDVRVRVVSYPAGFNIMSVSPYQSLPAPENRFGMSITASPPLGTTTTGSEPGQRWLTAYAGSRALSNYTGRQTVRRFDVDPATGYLLAADMDFVLWEASAPSTTLTGTFKFRVRNDYAQPAAPRDPRVATSGSARTVTWTPSTSSDVRTTVVRLVSGDGARATPSSGRPVYAGTGRTATLPPLRPGRPWTIVAFAVDATGNVSPAARVSFAS